MKMFLSVLFGAGVCALIIYAGRLLKGKDERTNSSEILFAAFLGALVGVVNYFIPSFSVGTNVAFMAPVSLVLMACVYAVLIYQWYKNGAEWRELLPFVGVAVLCYPTTKAAALMTSVLFNNVTLITLINLIPTLILIGTIGFFIANIFYFRYKELNGGKDEKLCSIITIVAACALAAILVFTQVDWSGMAAARADVNNSEAAIVAADAGYDEATVVDAEGGAWFKFYNLDLQLDADPRNDFNFGPNPHVDGLTAEDYDRELRSRMAKDVALTAGDVAWIDAIVGTRYLGQFYESCKGDWAKTINATKEAWLADQGSFYQTLNSVFAFMDKASVTLDYQTSGLDDQMYMNSMTADGVPDVIVMTTTDHTGYFLTYHFLIKDQEFQVAYRIDCGFQPTNVQQVMGIVPDNTPRDTRPSSDTHPKPSDDDTKPKPSDDTKPKPSGDNPPQPQTDPPTPPSTPKKDPSTDPVNNDNANKGGGQNKPTDGAGENQSTDPRTDHPTGSQNNNNHGYSDPVTVTPSNPPVVEEHKSEPVVTDSNPMNYSTDPITNNGPADPSAQPISPEGDGAFTPLD